MIGGALFTRRIAFIGVRVGFIALVVHVTRFARDARALRDMMIRRAQHTREAMVRFFVASNSLQWVVVPRRTVFARVTGGVDHLPGVATNELGARFAIGSVSSRLVSLDFNARAVALDEVWRTNRTITLDG